ncbi:MAG: hypothetical protein ACXV4B_08230 [Halobacteriota archaeon]
MPTKSYRDLPVGGPVQLELEGIVAKDATAPYSAGRSTRWVKIKTAAGAQRERERRPER